MIAILRSLYAIARPSGLRPLAVALAIALCQALLQTFAVFSLIPLLGAAANMAAFRESRLGSLFIATIGGGSDDRVLIAAGLISLALLILGNVVSLAAEYSRSHYAYRVSHQLRVKLLTGMLDRRYEYFLATNTSQLAKHLIEDTGAVAGQLIMPTLDLIARVVLVLLLVALALAVEPTVVFAGAAGVVLYYVLVVSPIRKRGEATSRSLMRKMRTLYFEMYQILSGIKPIIATDRASHFVERAKRASKEVADEFPHIPMYSAIPRSGLELLVFGGMIIWVLTALVAGDNLIALLPRIGVMAVIAYRLMPSLQTLVAQAAALSAMRGPLDEVQALMREQDGLSAGGGVSAGDLAEPVHWSREIRFENVSFQYAGASEPTIRDVSFTIAKGKRVALVGPTGSGKSTLIDLLLGLLQPTSGRILVDGNPLGPETMSSWRRAVGYVPQELFLLDGTIAENIAFGWDSSELDRQRVGEVADLAHAREFIEDGRSHGFDALVGERGVRVSGGQRQRLALARALYGRPNILVMDEATSALDPQTERKVVAALAQSHDRLTVVTVTHRMSTVRDYDCIHYVEQGRIVASGDFAALSAAHDTFRAFAG